MIIDVYDDVLEHHVAEYISMEMKELSWKYDYRSTHFYPINIGISFVVIIQKELLIMGMNGCCLFGIR